MTDKLNVVNPFYERVGKNYLEKVERENQRKEEESKKVIPVPQIKFNANSKWPVGVTNKIFGDNYPWIYVPLMDLYFGTVIVLKELEWNRTRSQLKNNGLFMPTPYQFKGFLKYLKNSKEEKDKFLFEDITGIKNFGISATWLNAEVYTTGEEKTMFFETDYAISSLILKNYLKEDRSNISFEEWIDSNTPHGLPLENISYGKLKYSWPSFHGCVGRFVSSSNPSLEFYDGCDSNNPIPSWQGVYPCFRPSSGLGGKL